MGLLGEAIREHLELKRLHGADPGQIALKEREAFGDPAERVERHENAGFIAGEGGEPFPTDFIVRKGSRTESAESLTADGASSRVERPASSVGQETVELDMAAILYEQFDDDYATSVAPVGLAGVRAELGAHRDGSVRMDDVQLRLGADS